MRKALLDTDILSAIMRRDSAVLSRAHAYQQEHGKFTISIITRYEILRGLKAKDAVAQLRRFELFCAASEILPLSEPIVSKASDIYAILKKQGKPIGDADILIAATAIASGLSLVTGNVAHHGRIPGIVVENWQIP